MTIGRSGELEVLKRLPAEGVEALGTPLLFVHGAYAAAWCWDEYFLPYFASQGYPAYAVSLSGHGESRRKGSLDSFSIDDYVRDVEEIVEALPAEPVLIGHSMGGMVVQKYLESHPAAAVVLLSSVPPQGLLGSAFGLMFRKPALLADLNRIMGGGLAQLESLRDALFHQPIAEEKLAEYFRRSQPESHRAIWDMTLFNLPSPMKMNRAPMLVLGAEFDQLIPPSLVAMTARTYSLEEEIFPGLGHGMMLEQDWQRVAERIAAWLAERGL